MLVQFTKTNLGKNKLLVIRFFLVVYLLSTFFYALLFIAGTIVNFLELDVSSYCLLQDEAHHNYYLIISGQKCYVDWPYFIGNILFIPVWVLLLWALVTAPVYLGFRFLEKRFCKKIN